MLSIYSCVAWPSVCLLWRNVCLDLPPIFLISNLIMLFSILSSMNCQCILEVNPLLVASFPNIYSHPVCCLFILFLVSFALQKLLSLISSHLLLFLFPWETNLRKLIHLIFDVYIVSLVFHSIISLPVGFPNG